MFITEILAKILNVDIREQLSLFSKLLLTLLAWHKLANKDFFPIQQHSVHFLDGLRSSFFSLKVDKSITFRRSSFILSNLTKRNCHAAMLWTLTTANQYTFLKYWTAGSILIISVNYTVKRWEILMGRTCTYDNSRDVYRRVVNTVKLPLKKGWTNPRHKVTKETSFSWWGLLPVCPQHPCSMSLDWCLEFRCGSLIFRKLVNPWLGKRWSWNFGKYLQCSRQVAPVCVQE